MELGGDSGKTSQLVVVNPQKNSHNRLVSGLITLLAIVGVRPHY